MNKKGSQREDIQHQIMPPDDKRFRWKQMHHTWAFWIFLLLMFVAIIYYIVSVDFAFAPR